MIKKAVEKLLPIAEKVGKKYRDEKEKIPKHFNLLDLVGKIYETKHSKILGELLKYKYNDKYFFLESFLKKINLDLKVENPAIEIEKENIDILIRDKEYAIIIENKINWAKDQPKQIERYIYKTESKGYDISKIYVVYLTRYGSKEVEKQSLGNYSYICLKDINYNNHILTWLEEVLMEVPLKEEILISGIRQYIDTLKGMFNLRKGEKEIMDKIAEILKNKLELENKDDAEKIKIIKEKEAEFQKCLNGLSSLKNEVVLRLTKEVAERIKNHIEERKDLFKEIVFQKCPDTGIEATINLKEVCIEIEGEEIVTDIDMFINHKYGLYDIWFVNNKSDKLKTQLGLTRTNYNKKFVYSETPIEKEKEFLDFLDKELFPIIKTK